MRCLMVSIAEPSLPALYRFFHQKVPSSENQPTYPVWMVGCTTCSPCAQVPTFQRADRSIRIAWTST